MYKNIKDAKEYASSWYQNNKRNQNLYYIDYRDKLKQEMVRQFGGVCLSCGEEDYIVLVLDHIYDDGCIDRKQGLEGGHKLYQRLKKAGWPKDRHQLLCHNCNFRKEYRRRKDAVRLREAG